MHTLLDLRGDIPTCIWITDGKVHDVNVLDHLIPEPGAIYIMDRAYLDFQRLYHMHQNSAVFVTRSKTNTGLRRIYFTQGLIKQPVSDVIRQSFQAAFTAKKIIRKNCAA